VSHLTTVVFLYLKHHPEDGTDSWQKHVGEDIVNKNSHKMHLLVVLHFINLINARNVEQIKITGYSSPVLLINNTSQHDFGTRKVYCVYNVPFHAESKYAIKIFPSPTGFVQWPF